VRSVLALVGLAVLITDCAVGAELIQNPVARKSIDLNGQWRIIPDPYESGYYNHRFEEKPDGYFINAKARTASDLVEYDFSKSQKLTVPGDWNSQDERLFFYEGTIWYEKDFTLDKQADKRYILYFGAANYTAVAYVNGVKAGNHEGGFTPFQFDVTDRVRAGENFVVVKVDNRRERDNVPAVNTDWWNFGGITRPVSLLEVNATYLADYLVGLEPGQTGSISGWVKVLGSPPAGSAKGTQQTVTVGIPDLDIEQAVQPDNAGFADFRFAAEPQLWSPETPKLYDVLITYNGETVADRIGFRDIRVRGEDILLNGQPVYLRGISIHEEAPDRAGRAWSERDARTTLGWAKELGCNFVRLAHYPHNEAMLRAADEMGLMVWSEIPVYWTIQFDNPAVYAKAERQLEEMIRRDRNRASIVMWSVANETPGTEARLDFLGRLITRARALDGSRLLTAASDTQQSVDGVRLISDPIAEWLDVIGVNSYCGWYIDAPRNCAAWQWRSASGKPVIVSEFGAGALQGKHGRPDERWTEEYQAEVYRSNLVMLDNMPFVRGATPWILKDFRSPRRPLPGIQDFWNRKGLLSETGERKQAWAVLRDYYASASGRVQP
jgi:beta-glucuronidase